MSDSANINDLFSSAVATGGVGQEALQAINVPDLGAQIMQGFGTICADDVPASEVVLASLLIDDSGSISVIREDPNDWNSPVIGPQSMCDGHNLFLSSLVDAKNDGVFMHTRYLNGEVLFPYVSLEDAVKMNSSNYNPRLGTPLYDQTAVFLGTVLAKAQQFIDDGVNCRTVSFIVSDGADEHSVRQTAASVRKIVEDMLRSERHIIGAMGINDGYTDFKQVFGEMGIPDEWILTPHSTESEIRKAFVLASKSAVRASQSAGSFSKTAMGGFGA